MLKQPLLLHINHTVFLRDDVLVMVDRRYLPGRIEEVSARSYEEVAEAIEGMIVQGAGDIAITAGYGLYLAARDVEKDPTASQETVLQYLEKARQRLVRTRPTGHHLAALLNKMVKEVDWEKGRCADQLLESVELAIEKQQRRSELTGRWASEVLENGDTILTHCFPGAALLYMLCLGRDQGKEIKVVAGETRPYLQGARLTAWSVAQLGIPVTLITDNMAAYCMNEGMVNKVFTAADRIAMDGTVANKVGTFQLALVARYHQVPFYVLGYGGPDRNCASGGDIPIEVRDPQEVLCFNGVRITGDNVKGFYPAFDLTPPQMVEEIITDRGRFIPYHIHRYWKTRPEEINGSGGVSQARSF
ncbi:MAG TPA: s-methyl-5-thioribose-1-phosphate isomerase [Syntrophomonadaceae bacterium]|nr:s-methyl-5-thioribose-1-phosphate isomerase [Syntrophomonadaceae bacterium]